MIGLYPLSCSQFKHTLQHPVTTLNDKPTYLSFFAFFYNSDTPLKAGTVVTRTPLSALISLEHALVSEMFVSLTEELPGLSNTNLKALFLAHEMKKSQRGGGREEGGGEGAEEHEGENMTQGCGKRDTGRVDCGAEENGAQLVDEGEEETGRERAEEEKEEEEEEEEEKEEEEEEVAEKEEEEEEEKKKEREEIEEEVDKEEKEVKKEKEEEEEENEEEEEEEEEGGRSFWQPYLDSLPTVLHTTLFFTEDDLLHLQTSMVTISMVIVVSDKQCLPLCSGEGVCRETAESSQEGS